MSCQCIINQSTAEDFTALFDPDALSNCNDVETLVQLFNEQCSSVFDIVVLFKSRQISPVKSSPWINESIHCYLAKMLEDLWEATKLEVHQLHLK